MGYSTAPMGSARPAAAATGEGAGPAHRLPVQECVVVASVATSRPSFEQLFTCAVGPQVQLPTLLRRMDRPGVHEGPGRPCVIASSR